MADFFISYNSADEAKAEWIAWTLRSAGFSVRFAKWELCAGQSIAAWTDAAMEDCERVIAVASPDYFAPKESEGFLLAGAQRFAGTIILVLARGANIPKLYAPRLRIDLTGVDEAEARDRLVGALSLPGPPAATPRGTPQTAAPPFEPAPAAPPFRSEPHGEDSIPVIGNRSYSGWFGFLSLAGLIGLVSADEYAGGLVVGSLWEGVTSAWLSMLLLALYAVVAWAMNIGLNTPHSRRVIAAALLLDRGGELYRSVTGRVLDWIDRAVSSEQQAKGKPPGHWGIAFSPRLFEVCLLLALFYPIFSFYSVWAVTNAPGKVGISTLVPSSQQLSSRAFIIGGVMCTLILGQLSRRQRAQRKAVQAHLYLGLAFAIASIALPFGIIDFFPRPPRNVIYIPPFFVYLAAWFAFAIAAYPAILAAAAFPIAFSIAVIAVDPTFVALVAPVILAIALIGFGFFRKQSIGLWGRQALSEFITIAVATIALPLLWALWSAEARWEQVFAPALLPGIFFCLAKAFEAVLEVGPQRLGRRGLFYVGYALALVTILSFVTLNGNAVKLHQADGKSFMVMVGFLPLLTAVFSFASTGLTRYCLRRGLRPGFLAAFKWSLIAAIGAVIVFVSLVLSAIGTVHYVRDAGGAPLASLNEIFTGIARDPNSYWWLYLTFFSTLVPTLLHLGVACFSFIALAPASLQRTVAGWVGAMDRNSFANIGGRAVLPLIVTASAALPFLGLYTLGLWIAVYHGEVGGMFFRLALGFAAWLDPKYVEGVDAILTGGSG